MEKLKEIKVSNIIFYLINFFKIHLKGLIIWLLIALFIGLCFGCIAVFTREGTIISVRNKDTQMITSMVSTFINSYNPKKEEWNAIFKPIGPKYYEEKKDPLFGVAIFKNKKIQFVNHSHLALYSYSGLKKLTTQDIRYSIVKIKTKKEDLWEIVFFRPELKYYSYYFSNSCFKLEMLTVPIRMFFDEKMLRDLNLKSMKNIFLPPFVVGVFLTFCAYIVVFIINFKNNKELLEKDKEKLDLLKEYNKLKNQKSFEEESLSYVADQIESEIELVSKFIKDLDKEKLKHDYDHFIKGIIEYYDLKNIKSEFCDNDFSYQVHDAALFHVFSEYLENLLETALTRYSSASETFFKKIYYVKASEKIYNFIHEIEKLDKEVLEKRIEKDYSVKALNNRANELGFGNSLDNMIETHISLSLKDNIKKNMILPVKSDRLGMRHYVTFWILPIFVIDIEEAKEYSKPILKSLEYDEKLFIRINDVIKYRNISVHGRENKSSSLVKMFQEQFMSVFSAIVKGYNL